MWTHVCVYQLLFGCGVHCSSGIFSVPNSQKTKCHQRSTLKCHWGLCPLTPWVAAKNTGYKWVSATYVAKWWCVGECVHTCTCSHRKGTLNTTSLYGGCHVWVMWCMHATIKSAYKTILHTHRTTLPQVPHSSSPPVPCIQLCPLLHASSGTSVDHCSERSGPLKSQSLWGPLWRTAVECSSTEEERNSDSLSTDQWECY